MKRILNLVLVVLLISCATSKPEQEKLSSMNVPYTGTEIEMEIPSLKDIYSDYFVIGASIEPFQIIGAEGALLSKHFSGITAENVMKQLPVHPEEGKYTFGPADQLLEYAKINNMKVRGHTLVWHHPYQTAKWMFTDEDGNPASRELLLERLRDHIHTVVGRYKGQIYAWDVVNEAIDISQKDNLRHTDWYNLIGPDYIAKAFGYAHEADPRALLFLNDYDTYDEQKGEALYELAKKLKHSSVPIHGLGMQFHISLTHPRMDAIEQTILKMRTLGLQLHITELDMSLYSHEYEILDSAPHDYLVRQAYRYKELFDLFKIHSDVINSVTFWGYHDGHSWLNTTEKPNWPLLFDREYKPKYAYWALVDPTQLPEDIPIFRPQEKPFIDGEINEHWFWR